MGTNGSGLTAPLSWTASAPISTRRARYDNFGSEWCHGRLTFRNNATGDINGSLTLTSSGNDLSAASLNVESQATLQLRSLIIGASNSSTLPRGRLRSPALRPQLPRQAPITLTIGTASGNIGNLNVQSGGTFTSGTAQSR